MSNLNQPMVWLLDFDFESFNISTLLVHLLFTKYLYHVFEFFEVDEAIAIHINFSYK